MYLLGRLKKDVDKDKDGKNVPKLDSAEIVLVQCILVKNDYQHTSKFSFTFVLNKQLGQLIYISPHYLTLMNKLNTKFSLLKCDLQTKLVKHLILKMILI